MRFFDFTSNDNKEQYYQDISHVSSPESERTEGGVIILPLPSVGDMPEQAQIEYMNWSFTDGH